MLTFLVPHAPLMTTVNGHELFRHLANGKISSSALPVNIIHSSPFSLRMTSFLETCITSQ